MKPKNILTIVLLAFVGVSIAVMLTNNNTTADMQMENSSVSIEPGPVLDDQLVVYYFHRNMRCVVCVNLEGYAMETLKAYFADELDSGAIRWQVVNMDQFENRPYVQKYHLVSNSIILSQMQGGQETRWDNLNQIWQKVNDKDGYIEYVRENIQRQLESVEL